VALCICVTLDRRKSKENCYKPPLACFSCFWSLITLLFLRSVPAYPVWAAVEKGYLLPGLQTVYVDPESIRREGNLMTIWQLIDFKSMQGSARGPYRFCLRGPTSNLTVRKNAFGFLHSRSFHAVWEAARRPMVT